MKKRILLVSTLILFLILTACSPSVESPSPKGIFYEVSGGKNAAYLFGSVHAGTKDMYPIDKVVEDAFSKANALVVEVDMTTIDPAALAKDMATFGLFKDGTKLREVIGQERFGQILDRLSPLGVTAAVLDQLRPWYAAMLLSQLAVQESGYSLEQGVDSYFTGKAKGKEIIGLETASDQLTPYTLLSEESQVMYLESTLTDVAKVPQELEKLIAIWRNGDIDGVTELRQAMLTDAETESLESFAIALTEGRDEKMADKIAGFLEDSSGKTYFVVIGYLHLAGEKSVVDNLRQMGYEVKKVTRR